MESLKKRLENCGEEVIEHTKYHGRSETMYKFGIKSYTAFARWLEEETGVKTWGFNPVLGLDRNTSLGDQLVDAFLRKVAQLETEKAKLAETVALLRWQLAQRKERDEAKALVVLAECQV